MTILQRRLAEIQNRSGQPAPAEPAAPAATPTPNAAGESQVELPAQSTPALAAGQPEGAGTAEAPAAAVIATDLGSTAAAPGTPEAAASAETATHVSDAVTVDGSDTSAPAARALEHYGADALTTRDPEALPAAQHIDSATPAPIADPEILSGPNTAATVEDQAPELPVVDLHASSELEASAEPVASLPTSSDTPLNAAPADVAAIDAGEEPTGVE